MPSDFHLVRSTGSKVTARQRRHDTARLDSGETPSTRISRNQQRYSFTHPLSNFVKTLEPRVRISLPALVSMLIFCASSTHLLTQLLSTASNSSSNTPSSASSSVLLLVQLPSPILLLLLVLPPLPLLVLVSLLLPFPRLRPVLSQHSEGGALPCVQKIYLRILRRNRPEDRNT
jgi:hypothetical protein